MNASKKIFDKLNYEVIYETVLSYKNYFEQEQKNLKNIVNIFDMVTK